MTEFRPVETLADLATLDKDEVLAGYMDGLNGEPPPGDNRCRSYHHGYGNGAVDAGRLEKSAAQARLAREVVRRWRLT